MEITYAKDVDGQRGRAGKNSRRSVRVQQDIPVFEILRVGPCLEVLLEGVAALEGGDGRGVDGGVRGCVGHGCGEGGGLGRCGRFGFLDELAFVLIFEERYGGLGWSRWKFGVDMGVRQVSVCDVCFLAGQHVRLSGGMRATSKRTCRHTCYIEASRSF